MQPLRTIDVCGTGVGNRYGRVHRSSATIAMAGSHSCWRHAPCFAATRCCTLLMCAVPATTNRNNIRASPFGDSCREKEFPLQPLHTIDVCSTGRNHNTTRPSPFGDSRRGTMFGCNRFTLLMCVAPALAKEVIACIARTRQSPWRDNSRVGNMHSASPRPLHTSYVCGTGNNQNKLDACITLG